MLKLFYKCNWHKYDRKKISINKNILVLIIYYLCYQINLIYKILEFHYYIFIFYYFLNKFIFLIFLKTFKIKSN